MMISPEEAALQSMVRNRLFAERMQAHLDRRAAKERGESSPERKAQRAKEKAARQKLKRQRKGK